MLLSSKDYILFEIIFRILTSIFKILEYPLLLKSLNTTIGRRKKSHQLKKTFDYQFKPTEHFYFCQCSILKKCKKTLS